MDNKVFEQIFLGAAAPRIDTEQFLTAYYLKNGSNPFKAAENAQNNIAYFLHFAGKLIADAASIHVPSVFSAVSKDVVVLNASYFPVKNIHKKLLVMDWRNFEYFSSDILQFCFNAVEVRTTQPTADGGLDFEGKLAIRSVSANDIYGFIEIYGQSKRYANNVGIYDIKSFVAFANTKKRNFVHPPQLFIFFTTSDFATNAQNELKENGFLGFSGLQLSSLIYSHQKVLENKSEIYSKYFVNK